MRVAVKLNVEDISYFIHCFNEAYFFHNLKITIAQLSEESELVDRAGMRRTLRVSTDQLGSDPQTVSTRHRCIELLLTRGL